MPRGQACSGRRSRAAVPADGFASGQTPPRTCRGIRHSPMRNQNVTIRARQTSLIQKIGDSIVADSDAVELSADIAEFTLDQLLDDNLLKEIPWVGWIFRAKAAYSSISDRILLAKIVRSLLELHLHAEHQRTALLRRLEDNTDERKRVGQHLLIALEKVDDLDKPGIIAQCFSYYLQGLLSYCEFSQLADAITKCHSSDFAWFYKAFPRINISPPYQRLFLAGLAQLKDKQLIPVGGEYRAIDVPLEFEMSELGNLLQDVVSKRLAHRPDSDRRRQRNLNVITKPMP
jgi:hypothetical protein